MTGLHESTLALSVYTALARHGSMTEESALALLQRAWDPKLEANEVRAGIDYLAKRNMVSRAEDGQLTPAQFAGGTARTVLRNPANQSELIFSPAARLQAT